MVPKVKGAGADAAPQRRTRGRASSQKSQSARPRERIIDAALALAASGGMGAMQMREVAARADVSTRTLHVHFPTKNYLLLAALTERGEAADSSPDSRSVRGSDPVQRVVDTLQAQTETLLSMPELAKALVVALSSPDPLVIPLLRRRRQTTVAATVRGLTSGDPTPAELEVALILDQVWFAALVGWATGVEDPDFIMGSLESAARHLLPIRE